MAQMHLMPEVAAPLMESCAHKRRPEPNFQFSCSWPQYFCLNAHSIRLGFFVWGRSCYGNAWPRCPLLSIILQVFNDTSLQESGEIKTQNETIFLVDNG